MLDLLDGMFGVLVVALRFLVGGCERCLNLGVC